MKSASVLCFNGHLQPSSNASAKLKNSRMSLVHRPLPLTKHVRPRTLVCRCVTLWRVPAHTPHKHTRSALCIRARGCAGILRIMTHADITALAAAMRRLHNSSAHFSRLPLVGAWMERPTADRYNYNAICLLPPRLWFILNPLTLFDLDFCVCVCRLLRCKRRKVERVREIKNLTFHSLNLLFTIYIWQYNLVYVRLFRVWLFYFDEVLTYVRTAVFTKSCDVAYNRFMGANRRVSSVAQVHAFLRFTALALDRNVHVSDNNLLKKDCSALGIFLYFY